ncbi:hypothetical protein EDB86DRAFT_1975128 [Lactarius hatsudake]|nr:hypothetical protein EDB86DRAFT_1975128 [Lactarius hatsudake]
MPRIAGWMCKTGTSTTLSSRLRPSHLCALHPCGLTPLIRRPDNALFKSIPWVTNCNQVDPDTSWSMALLACPYTLRSLTPEGTLEAALVAPTMQESAPAIACSPDFYGGHARRVRIIGDAHNGSSRAPTISFVVQDTLSRDIVRTCDATGTIGIRYGHLYAYALVDGLVPKIVIND